MSGRVLLDTNIVIALFAEEKPVKEQLAAIDEVFVSSIVLGELYFGARKSIRTDENIKRIDEFAASNTILRCDMETARQYGVIKHQLRLKGKPIPENDIWIASIAIQHQLTLITRDGHFENIDALLREQW